MLTEEYNRWTEKAVADKDLIPELRNMTKDQINDAFYRDLGFGTGGLRGRIGAGTNRMNVYTVARATIGLSAYLRERYDDPSAVIGYDSRIKSRYFAETTAMVFAENGIRVNMWDRLLPVPTVSYAVRYLHASAGVMITASHNPAEYNGYKVYGNDGCQITTEAASEILSEIEKKDYFDHDIPEFDSSAVSYIPDEVLTSFIGDVKKQKVVEDDIDRDVSIVYTPLNGTGLEPVTRVLMETGFTNVTVVDEQRDPDGNFTTCPYPNPEVREAMELGIEYCRKQDADLLLATDPDCDRCGIAVKDSNGEYRLLSGNETGLLLFDFICSQRTGNGTMPEHPVMMKTIVTSDMGEQIAEHYGVETINVLTGFKYIGEQIGLLAKHERTDDFIFGFEESYGYLTGTYVRDKDGVEACLMIAEMYAYYRTHSISLIEKLDELYHTYGYRLNTLHSYKFDGESGMHKMQEIMALFRGGVTSFAGLDVIKVLDYRTGIESLPISDVLKFMLGNNSSVVIRPSGTEPKLKVYISICADIKREAERREKEIRTQIEEMIG